MFILPALNPIAISVLGFPIYWYGITMGIAILSGSIVANILHNKIFNPKSKDLIITYAPIIVICGILSARLYFCCLNFSYYSSNIAEIFNLRQGGLSIHGALLGGILALIILAIRNKTSIIQLLDSLAVGTFLGQAIGRWGNYFNSEAFGKPTISQNFGVFIPENLRPIEFSQHQLFHPTFLYESLLDICGFFIVLFILKHFGQKYNGLTFSIYLILYAIIRFFVEQIRLDSALNIHTIPIAQIVSLIMFIIGIFGCILAIRKAKD